MEAESSSAQTTPSDAPQALPAFVKFGRFQLVARLGKGGMGDVFLAVAPGVEGANKLLVVKRLHEGLVEDGNMRTLFLAEGRLAARLNHPNVVQTYEVGEEGGILYLSMEYLEGQPLSQLNKKLGETPIDPVIAARIMSETLAGLHYAHELRDYGGNSFGLVHRDVSPQNILVTYDGTSKVLDFGIAKIADQDNRTQTGILKGKIAYMAPEQVTGEVDRRSDVFSAGIVLWELLTRRRLMADSSSARTLARVMSGPPAPKLSTILPNVHPLLEQAVARALERNPEDRFQSAQAMRDGLEAYIAKSGRFVRQEEISQLMATFFDKRRQRVATQVRTFMVAAREAHSLLELPAVKGSAATRTAGETGPTLSITRESPVEPSDTSNVSLPMPGRPPDSSNAGQGVAASVRMPVGAWTRSHSLAVGAALLAIAGAGLWVIRSGNDAEGTGRIVPEAARPEQLAQPAPAQPLSTPPVPTIIDQLPLEQESRASGPKRSSARPGLQAPFPPGAATASAKVAPAHLTPAGETTATEPAPAPTPGTPGKRKYRSDF
jgi:serine/threonine protein kinase